jgi:penicillin-binding protein 1A
MVLDLLSATVERGTGRNAQLAVESFGKTGTTQDARDAIFVGFAGDLVVGVWVGRDDNQPIPGLAGGGVPARVWRDFMSSAIPGAAVRAPAPVDEDPDPVLQLDEDGINGSVNVGPVQLGVSADDEGITLSAQPGDAPPTPLESRMPPPDEPDPDLEPPRF